MEVRYVLIVIVISYKLAKVITISDIYYISRLLQTENN